MERLTHKLASSLPGLIVRGATEVHKRPPVAAVLYAAAIAGVLASPFGSGPRSLHMTGRTLTPRSSRAEGTPEPAQTSLIHEFERAGLRVVKRNYRPGEDVYTPGDAAHSLFFMLSGVVRTYRIYGDSKEATTALLKEGAVFGVLDLQEDIVSHEEFAESMTETCIASVRKAAVVWLVKRKPEVALSLFSAFSERVRQNDDLLGSLLQREVASRLSALLLNLRDRFGEEREEDEAGTVTIELILTHFQLASMIASTREAVSKVMTDLRREGLIEVRERKIVIVDLPGLLERAEGGSRRIEAP